KIIFYDESFSKFFRKMWGNHDASEAVECNFFESLRFVEVKLIAPARVVVGNDGCPACVPAGSPLRAPNPASNTMVAGPPGDGIVTIGVGVSALECTRSTSATAFFRWSCPSNASGD